MRNHILMLASSLVLGVAGCQNDAKTQGQATYAKPASEGGKPVSKQNRGDLSLSVTLQGDAVWDLVEGLACTLTGGSAEGQVEASGSLGADGSYASAFATAQGSFASSDDILCDSLEDVQFEALTTVQVTASIPANEENCNEFCQASAEADCEGSFDQASCIADAKASCDTDCAQSQKITGSGEISADALATLNDDLAASGKINANVDIVFDSLE